MPTPPPAIGRARTALVFGQGDAPVAVLSTVIAQTAASPLPQRIAFAGPVSFAEATARHIRDVVLPVIDRIQQLLDLTPRDFQVSVANIGAASVADVGAQVSGFSADVPVLLAMLGAILQTSASPSIVSTGHLASADGCIGPVRDIPAKLAAAVADSRVQRFIYPDLDADRSFQVLSANERQRAVTAIAEARQHIQPVAVADVDQLVRAVFDDHALVLSSLRNGYFELSRVPADRSDPVACAAAYLIESIDQRFWSVLERALHARHTSQARRLLAARLQYHCERQSYPSGFGQRFLLLVRSLPPAVRRLKSAFPLIDLDQCIRLGQLARKQDHHDLQDLIDAARGPTAGSPLRPPDGPHSTAEQVPDLLNSLLDQISAETLAQRVGLPVDAARAAYLIDTVTVDNYDQFCQITTAFYQALLRHTDTSTAASAPDLVAANASALLERAFRDRGGTTFAWAEARQGLRGGLRFILDAMTEQLKTEQQAAYVNGVLKQALDPLDWDAKVGLIEALLARIRDHLPAELRDEPAARFATSYELVVQAYAASLDRVKHLLRRL